MWTLHFIASHYPFTSIFYRFIFEVLNLSALIHILKACVNEVALIFVDNPDPEGQGFCQAGFSVDFTKVTNLPPQACLCISSLWLHTPVWHVLLFVQNLTAVISSFKWLKVLHSGRMRAYSLLCHLSLLIQLLVSLSP